VFFPWLAELLKPDSGQEARLRREVVGMLRGSRLAPKVRKFSKFVQYAGIAGEIAALAQFSLPGFGLVVTAVGGGAEKLAARFESKSRWLLCASAGVH
jgi:hypothetical protein